MPDFPFSRKQVLNALVRSSREAAKYANSYSLNVRPAFFERIEDELAQPDTMDEFLPQGLKIADSLVHLSWSRRYDRDFEGEKKLREIGVKEVTSRLGAALRLGKILGVKELEIAANTAHYARFDDNQTAERQQACSQTLAILTNPQTKGVTDEKRLSIAERVSTIAAEPERTEALEIVLGLLNSPKIDVFKRYETAVRLFDTGTSWDPKDRLFTQEQTLRVGSHLPGLIDDMLAKDGPKAAKLLFEGANQDYAERGSMQPVAKIFMAPKLREISAYLGFDISELYRKPETGFNVLPKSLILPDRTATPLLIFDLGKVIAPYDDDELVRTMAARCTGPDAAAKIPEYFKRDWDALQTGAMDDRELHGKFVTELGFQGNFKEFGQVWCSHTRHDVQMEALIPELARTHQVAILSNSTRTHALHFLINYPVLQRADEVFFSYKIGKIKPNADAFEHVLTHFGRKPEDAIFIDDIPRMVDGAKAAGLKGIVFTGHDQLVDDLASLGVAVPHSVSLPRPDRTIGLQSPKA